MEGAAQGRRDRAALPGPAADGLAGIQGAKRRGKPWRTTISDPAAKRRPDLVDRKFTAEAPNRLWVGDFTYLRCWEARLFFAFILDVFSRMIVGWQLAANMRTDLVLDALRMALGTRPRGADFQLIAHTDRRAVTSADYTQQLDDAQVLASVGASATAMTTRWPRASWTPTRPS